MIDNELVITVRVRIPGELDYRTRASLAGAIADNAVTTLNDHAGSLAGVELAFPTFEEYPIGPVAATTTESAGPAVTLTPAGPAAANPERTP
jgi:hypothetical protein